MTTVEINALEARSTELLALSHRVKAEFADELTRWYASDAINNLKIASKALQDAGFDVSFTLWGRIEYAALSAPPVLFCSLSPGLWSSSPKLTDLRYELTTEEAEEYRKVVEISDAHWKEHMRLDREISAARAANYVPRKEVSYEELLAMVKETHDDQEDYYTSNGPRKKEQEHYTGVQVVDMNVDMLVGWLDGLDDTLDAGNSFEELPAAQRRAVWETSAFHFGINGYNNKDADHYWTDGSDDEEGDDDEDD